MSSGCVYTHPLWRIVDAEMCLSLIHRGTIYIFGVGFEVAYLSELGKFDGLKSEISDRYGSHAFLYKS